jgi:hypothetical protein
VLGLGEDRLSIYLNDHLAGATAGVSLARRAAGNNRSTGYGEVLQALADELDEDRRTLVDIMGRLAVGRDRVKVVLGWGAEKAGRLKFNGALAADAAGELETLAIGIHGKELLWRALRERATDDSTAARFDELIARAERQHEDVERHRREAAAQAVGPARIA